MTLALTAPKTERPLFGLKLTRSVCSDLLFEARRERATRSFAEFVKQAWTVVEPETPFVDNWHIKAICDHLQEVSDGTRITKLLINVPPGTMKSLLVSVFWPVWVWTHKPEKRFFYASYGEDLVVRDSVKCKTLMRSGWYQARWGSRFDFKKDTEKLFSNTKGGWRMCTTVGGKATGHHPDFKVVDDPHNAMSADSELERKMAVNWWDGTMSSRGVTRGAKSVIVMQRLHAKDLSAHCLEKGGWTHICLPMQYEAAAEITDAFGNKTETPRMKETPLGFKDPRTKDGELLWPELFDLPKVIALTLELGIYHAAGQLQQRPAPREGGMFKRAWFNRIVNAIPPDMTKWIRYWDKAGTEGGTGARTAGALVGITKTGLVVIGDIIAVRMGAVDREKLIESTAVLDKQRYGHVEIWTEQEPGSGGKESAEATVRNLAGFVVKVDRVTGAKELRAEPLASQASVGNVVMLVGGWIPEFIDELEVFPAGRCRDKVDASGGAFNKLYESRIKALDLSNKPAPRPREESAYDAGATLGEGDF